MICPTCNSPLREMIITDIKLDVCNRCAGIWFDNFELKKLDEPHEPVGEILLELKRESGILIDHDRKRNCPKCESMIMMRQFYNIKKQVEVDECPNCAGFWLDDGELALIRSQYKTEEERRGAFQDYFEEAFGNQLKVLQDESAAKLEKSRQIAKIFKFICPSHYFPGKQDWGAF